MTDHANALYRHSYKIGRPAGDTPAVMQAAAAHIEHLERELRAAEIRLHDVATHCATVEAELAEIKRRTYVAVTCNHVARMERAEARVAELEAERAEREKQEPVAWLDRSTEERPGDTVWLPDDLQGMSTRGLVPLYAAPPVITQHEPVTTVEDRYNADGKSCHITDDLPAGMPLYAAPPVTAQSEGQIDKPTSLLRRAADYLGDAGAPRLASEISSYLESQAQPTRGEG